MCVESIQLPDEVEAVGDGERQQVDAGREGTQRNRREDENAQSVADQSDDDEDERCAEVAVVRQLNAGGTVEQEASLVRWRQRRRRRVRSVGRRMWRHVGR